MSDAVLEVRHIVPTAAELAEVALTRGEYDLAVDKLGRTPTHVELGIIGALWSEHCGYKTSKPLLSRLPTEGAAVLQGPGENAGAVDIGDGLACVFKIESHNHPSAIEPYQGAATGVGGILRDIFTMGARPVALLDSLRFGPIDEPAQARLLDGVVAGIGGYGNCIGVPTVGGEIAFDSSYRHNCLVNAMCVGVIEHDKLMRATAGPGHPVLLVGADTGRDGIHGATFASVAMDEQSDERRPAVQVGNPFLEKCLMEACLELAGDPRIVAIQDLGAAGLTSSTAELAHRGDCGIELDVSKVARRERGMTPYEVMLSESQERMLIVCRSGEETAIAEVFARWDLHSDVIGRTTDTGNLVVRDGADVACDLPLAMLIDEVPLRTYDVDPALPPVPTAALDVPWDAGETLLRLLASPNVGSRKPVYRRYDHQVGDDTVIPPGGDAALLRVRGTAGALALATDGNSRYVALDARHGSQIAVCEAARNVVATGARPLAITNCLNFGNPELPEVYRQLQDAIDGIAQACVALSVPVVSGNVSLYNDTSGVSINPTPVIGMVGKLDDLAKRCTASFDGDGDIILLIGPIGRELGGSELQHLVTGSCSGTPPAIDLDLEQRVQTSILAAIDSGLLRSAHDCAEGGLGVALAESCIFGGRGAVTDFAGLSVCEHTTNTRDADASDSDAGVLFGETQSRFIVSCTEEAELDLIDLAAAHGVPAHRLGITGGDHIIIAGVDVALTDAQKAFDNALAVHGG